MHHPIMRAWLLVALVLTVAVPGQGGAQERLSGSERRVLRLNVGLPGNRILGVDADFGVAERTSFVASARLWRFGNYGCALPGPVLQEDGSFLPQPDFPPCIPDGWSISGGLRAAASVFFAEADLGLYRYDHGQVFMAPYGGVRAGLSPTLWDALELQVALHLIVISSYNGSGFDPDSWFLGAFDMGLGVPLG